MNQKNSKNLNIAKTVWDAADILRDDYERLDYPKVILPMAVLRRFDCILEPTKEQVLKKYNEHKKLSEKTLDKILNNAAGMQFHNRSKYTFKKLLEDPNNIAANFKTYLNGFSEDVRDILTNFKFEGHIDDMDKHNILYPMVKYFSNIDLHSDNVSNREMGIIFEEVLRKFSENKKAGEHFTAREIIKLMAELLFIKDMDTLKKPRIIRKLYDPTGGTGGMLSVSHSFIKEINPKAELYLFCQEVNDISYAICKADMLIKGLDINYIKHGNTITEDRFKDEVFDYMISNPPLGYDYKKFYSFVKEEYEFQGFDGRFGPGIPRKNDGQLLFHLHMLSKMEKENGGSRIAVITNGSPLFNGDAGSGESEIRKWIIENDWLETIIALPKDMFYNTGIQTYIWVLTNRKSDERKGKVQLINAEDLFEKMKKSLGQKRNYISDDDRKRIIDEYTNFTKSDICKIFDNEDFGYTKITVERPLYEDGKIVTNKKGDSKPDTSLRDTENVPLKQDIQKYFEKEVLPFVPDAWIDEKRNKVGYEINFTKYFYKYKPLRQLSEIKEEILKIKQESEGMIDEVFAE